MSKLPRNCIIPIVNADKGWHEKWYENRGKLNFPHPWRMLALGPPGVGKTTICKNMLLRQHPPFRKVVVVHADPGFTKEYEDIEADLLSAIPSPEEFEGKVKTLVILDDLEFKGMDKIQSRNLDRLYGYVSTHKNISVCLCAQDVFSVPAAVRRCASIWVIWRITDMDALATCARRTGMRSHEFKDIFDNLMPHERDSLWIDLTEGSPMKLRKNGFQEICMRAED